MSSEPASTVPAAAAEQQNDQENYEKGGHIHGVTPTHRDFRAALMSSHTTTNAFIFCSIARRRKIMIKNEQIAAVRAAVIKVVPGNHGVEVWV